MSNISLLDGLTNGLGATIGGGIFYLIGDVVKNNRGYSIITIILAALICLTIAFCYCILSKEYPSDEGTSEYSKKVFPDRKLVQTIVNGLIILGYTFLLCLYSISGGSYLGEYLRLGDYSKYISITLLTLGFLLNCLPKADIINKVLVGIKLGVLTLIGIYGLFREAFKVDNIFTNRSNPFTAIASSFGLFISLEGFEVNSIYSKNMKDKDQNIPLSYFLTILISAFIYILLSITVNKHLGPGFRQNSNTDFALIDLVRGWGFGETGVSVIVLTCLIANLSALTNTLSLSDIITKSYIKDTNLESTFLNNEVKVLNSSKSIFLIITCVVAMLFILMGSETLLKNLGSLLFLIIYGLVCYMSYLTIQNKEKNSEKINVLGRNLDHSTSKNISILGLVTCSIGTLILLSNIASE